MIRILALLSLALLPLPAAAGTPDIEAVPVTVLPAPDFHRAAPKAVGKGDWTLAAVSTKANQITDGDAWFEANGLELDRFDPANLPGVLPKSFRGLPLYQALFGKGHTLLLYGKDGAGARFVVAMEDKTGAFSWAFDFASFLSAPGVPEEDLTEQRVTWAAEEGGVLYVSNGHHTYASSSQGKNAYLTAIDVKAATVLWRSRPLVANANNFVVLDRGIVTGYGFTREPDFLYLLDKKTGAVVAQAKVKSGPEYIVARGGTLYVRCYDTDAVFEVRK